MKVVDIVAKYIELRDRKAVFKAEYEAKVAGTQSLLDGIEAKLLSYMSSTGVESIKTTEGTAYCATRNSASIADQQLFREFVKDQDGWDMVTMRANAKNVEAYRAANDMLPPGLNWSTEVVVNIRRS